VSLTTRVPALAPFQIRSFRFQWPADLLASWAFEMEGVILGWFVLVATGSVLALAVFGSLQFLGTLISPLFGMVGDRIGSSDVTVKAYDGLYHEILNEPGRARVYSDLEEWLAARE